MTGIARYLENLRLIMIRIAKALFYSVLTVIASGLPLFLSAGSVRFMKAWLFIGVFSIPMFLILTYLAIRDPVLFNKRMKANEDERSQMIIKLLLNLAGLVTLVVSGLDYRYRWSTVPVPVVVSFTFVIILGMIMLFLVLKQNSYGSSIIEIQEKHKVIDNGLYSVVRHPMYLAYSIIFFSSPFVLGSFYALIPAIFMPLLIAMRIKNEEVLLRKGLEGYKSYIQKVRFRLIPFVW